MKAKNLLFIANAVENREGEAEKRGHQRVFRRSLNGLLKCVRFTFVFAIFAIFSVTVYGQDVVVRLVIDGTEVFDLPAPPIVVDGRTLVPVREVFERVGGIVGWHAGHRQVSLFYGDDVIVMTIDEYRANFNGDFFEMHTPPIIHNERTMIPLRFPAEVFGFDVRWDDEKRAAIVNSPGNGNGSGDEPNEPESPVIILPPAGDDTPMLPVVDPPTLPPVDEPPEDDELPPPGVTARPVLNPEDLARDISALPIQTILHPQTTITALQTPRETGAAAFVAIASSPISEVQHFLLSDNRLVIDIHNAASALTGNFDISGSNVPISGVRASQFSQEPSVARIVFDVIGSAEYSVSLSDDRTRLTVSFSRNRISAVLPAQSDEFSQSLLIAGDVLPSITVSTEGFPHFITLNIDNADMAAAGGIFEAGNFASHFETGQNTDGTAFVRVFVRDEWPSFSLSQNANVVAFTLHRSISGMRYDSVNRELRISRELALNLSAAPRINDYLRFRYTFVLPAEAEVFGRGEMSVPDGFVNSVSLSRVGEHMHLTFNTARVLSFTVFEEPDYYVIRAQLPREISPFIVVIDPGHGGSAPGTSHHGVVEKDFALDVSRMVMQHLESDPFITAFATRREDVYVSVLGRAEFANNLGAGLFVSIHANAAEREGVPNPEPHGIETWYTISELETAANHSTDSRRVGQIFQQNLINRTNANNRGLRHEPDFVVLRETNMPAVLLELGFLTNPDEAALLACPDYRRTLASAIYQSIVEAFALA
ncbi:MAG: N-acetylmuramoyl-L-alanine amidase family protein [Defluviitaleaceae bacterium]|nr:N-acetylmuramoyl-L-alanine amidase family protein [Defluviitaleaceae bacterium]